MKPGFLQDAIKAKALKRQKEWVEPVVKEHKVTKEEYLLIKELETPKKKSILPPANDGMAAPIMMMAAPSGPDPKTLKLIEILQTDFKILKEENNKLKNDVKRTTDLNDKLNDDMQTLKNQNLQLRKDFQSFKEEIWSTMKNMKSTTNNSSAAPSNSNSDYNDIVIKNLQSDVKDLNSDITKLKVDISKLKEELGGVQKENSKLKTEATIATTSISTLKAQLQQLQLKSNTTIDEPQASPRRESKKITSDDTSSRQKTPSKSRTSTPAKSRTSTPSKSQTEAQAEPTKTSSSTMTEVTIAPFTAEKLEHHQKKDEEFTEFRKTKEGLYPISAMSIQEFGAHKVVLFHKKVYVPAKLREKLVAHYKTSYSSFTNRFVTDKIKEYCIWPTMDTDIPRILKELKS